jgi:hypothetical protein
MMTIPEVEVVLKRNADEIRNGILHLFGQVAVVLGCLSLLSQRSLTDHEKHDNGKTGAAHPHENASFPHNNPLSAGVPAGALV